MKSSHFALVSCGCGHEQPHTHDSPLGCCLFRWRSICSQPDRDKVPSGHRLASMFLMAAHVYGALVCAFGCRFLRSHMSSSKHSGAFVCVLRRVHRRVMFISKRDAPCIASVELRLRNGSPPLLRLLCCLFLLPLPSDHRWWYVIETASPVHTGSEAATNSAATSWSGATAAAPSQRTRAGSTRA